MLWTLQAPSQGAAHCMRSKTSAARSKPGCLSVEHAHRVVLLVLVQVLDLLLRIAQNVLVIHGANAGLPEGSPIADLHADFRVSEKLRSGQQRQG